MGDMFRPDLGHLQVRVKIQILKKTLKMQCGIPHFNKGLKMQCGILHCILRVFF